MVRLEAQIKQGICRSGYFHNSQDKRVFYVIFSFRTIILQFNIIKWLFGK